MLSILIPTYHYNVYPLAQELEKQALNLGIAFELICMDDGSFSPLNAINQGINTLTNCTFIENKTNVGRIATRQLLAQKAQYNWLLFLDADVMPKNSGFLKFLANEIQAGTDAKDAIFGGIVYDPASYTPQNSLRFTFGKNREESNATKRNKHPYKTVLSANMLVKKPVFSVIPELENRHLYGLDYLLGSILKKKRYHIKHIDNPVYHYGLEDNPTFLDKTQQALNNLHKMSIEHKMGPNQVSILKAYTVLKSLRLNKLFNLIVFGFKNSLEKNLLGAKPNLFLFDLYRLAYLCGL